MYDVNPVYDPAQLADRLAGYYGETRDYWLANLRQAATDDATAKDLWKRAMVADEVFNELPFDQFRGWLSEARFDTPMRVDEGQLIAMDDEGGQGPAIDDVSNVGPVRDDQVVQVDQLATNVPLDFVEIAQDPETVRVVQVEGNHVIVTNEALDLKGALTSAAVIEKGLPNTDIVDLAQWYRDNVAALYGDTDPVDVFLDGARKGRLSPDEEADMVRGILDDMGNAVVLETANARERLGDRADEVDALLDQAARDPQAQQQLQLLAQQDPDAGRYLRALVATDEVSRYARVMSETYKEQLEEGKRQAQAAYEMERAYDAMSFAPMPFSAGVKAWQYFGRPAVSTALSFGGNVAGSTLLLINNARQAITGPTYGIDTDLREWVSRVTDSQRYRWLMSTTSETSGILHDVLKVNDSTYVALDPNGNPAYAMDAAGNPMPPDASGAIIAMVRDRGVDAFERQTTFEWGNALTTAVSGLTETYLIGKMARMLTFGKEGPIVSRAGIAGSAFMASYNANYEDALKRLGLLKAAAANKYALGAALGEGLIESLNPLEAAIARPRRSTVMRALKRASTPNGMARTLAPTPTQIAVSKVKGAAKNALFEGFEGVISNLWSTGVAAVVNANDLRSSFRRLDANATRNEVLNGALSEGLGALFGGGMVTSHPGAMHIDALMYADRNRDILLPYIERRDPALAATTRQVLERADAKAKADPPQSPAQRASQLLEAHFEVVSGHAADDARKKAQDAIEAVTQGDEPSDRPSVHELETRRAMMHRGMVGTTLRSVGGITYELTRVEDSPDGKKYHVRVDNESDIILTEEQFHKSVDNAIDRTIIELYGEKGLDEAAQARKTIMPYVAAADVGTTMTQGDITEDDDSADDDVNDSVPTFASGIAVPSLGVSDSVEAAPTRTTAAVDVEAIAPISALDSAPQADAVASEVVSMSMDDPSFVADNLNDDWGTAARWAQTPSGRKAIVPVARALFGDAGIDTASMSDDEVVDLFAAVADMRSRGEALTPEAVAERVRRMKGLDSGAIEREPATAAPQQSPRQGQGQQQAQPQQGQQQQQIQQQPAPQQVQQPSPTQAPQQNAPADNSMLTARTPVPMRVNEVTRAAQAFIREAGFEGEVEVRVANRYDDLDEETRANVSRERFERAEAFIHMPSNVIWINANNIYSEEQLRETMAHEVVGHYGVHAVFGKELNSLLLGVAKSKRQRKAIKAIADLYGLDLRRNDDRIVAAEELIAHMAERQPDLTIVQRVIAGIRQGLRRLGIVREYTDRDIIYTFILPARNAHARLMGQRNGDVLRERRAAEANMRNSIRFSHRDKPEIPVYIDVGGVLRHTRNSNGELIHPNIQGIKNFWRWFGDSKVVDDEGRPLVVWHGGTFNPFDEDDGAFRMNEEGIHFGTADAAFDRVYITNFFDIQHEWVDETLQRIVSGDDTIEVITREVLMRGITLDPMKDYFLDVGYGLAQQGSRVINPVYLGMHPYYLRIINPVEGQDLKDIMWTPQVKEAFFYGHDGIYYKNKLEDVGSTSYIIMDSRQAKLADGNTGTFDPLDPMVRFSLLPTDETPQTIEVDGVQRPTLNAQGRLIHPTIEGIKNFWRWFGNSKAVDGEGRPLVLYHGTFADFDVFDTNQDVDYMPFVGAGIYTTTTPEDAWRNYADRESDDVESKAEIIVDMSDGTMSLEEAIAYVTNNGSGNIMPLYMRIERPFVIYPNRKESDVIVNSDEDIEELVNAIYDIAVALNVESVANDIIEELSGNDVTTNDLRNAIAKHAFGLTVPYGDGYLFSYMFPAVIETLGYDGVIMEDVSRIFVLPGVTEDTRHFISYNPSNVKSVTGNAGIFGRTNKDIRFKLKDAVDAVMKTSAKGTQMRLAARHPHLREGTGIPMRVSDFVNSLHSGTRPTHPVIAELFDEYSEYRTHVEDVSRSVTGNVPARTMPLRRFDRPSHMRTVVAFNEQDRLTHGQAEAMSLVLTVTAPRWHGGVDVVRTSPRIDDGQPIMWQVTIPDKVSAGKMGRLMQRVNGVAAALANEGIQVDIDLIGWANRGTSAMVVFQTSTREEGDLVREVMKDMGLAPSAILAAGVLARGHSRHTSASAIKGTGNDTLDAMADTAEKRARNRLNPERFLAADPFVTNAVVAARMIDNMVVQGMAFDHAVDVAASVTGMSKQSLRVFYNEAANIIEFRRRIGGAILRVPLLGKVLNKWFRMRAFLPEELRHLDILRRGSREWALRRAATIYDELDKLFGDDMGKREIAARYLEGNLRADMFDKLSATEREALDRARDSIDHLSVLIWMGRATTNPAVIDNVGKHLSRFYGVHIAEKNSNLHAWLNKLRGRPDIKDFAFDNLPDDVRDAVVDEMIALRADSYANDYDNYQAQGGTLGAAEYMRMRAEQDVRIILNDYQNEDFVPQEVSTDKITVDQAMLRKRKALPPAMRKAMGEITDGVARYYFTVYRMSAMAYNAMSMRTAAMMGVGKYFFNPKVHDVIPPGYTHRIAPEGSSVWKVLAGWTTSKEIRDDMRDAFKVSGRIMDFVYSMYVRAGAFVNWHSTVGSLPTQTRNFVGNMEFVMNMGWLSPGAWARVSQWAVTGKANPIAGLIEAAYQFDLLDQNIDINIIRQLTNYDADRLFKAMIMRKRGAPMSKVMKVLDISKEALNTLYRKGDDFFKLLGFIIEARRYAKALYGTDYDAISPEQQAVVRNYAATVVRSVLPNYAGVGKVQRALATTPIIGQFTTFQFEAMRTWYNYWSLIHAEYKKGGAFAALAARRLAWGLAYRAVRNAMAVSMAKAAYAFVVGLPRYLASLMGGGGGDDEDRFVDAVRLMAPPWADDRTLVPIAWDGYRLMVYDLNSIEPWARNEEVANIFLDRPPEEWAEELGKNMFGLLEPTIVTQMFAEFKEAWETNLSSPPAERIARILGRMAIHAQGTLRAIDSATRKTETVDEATRKLILKGMGITTYILDPVIYARRRINELFDYQNGRITLIKDDLRRRLRKTDDPADKKAIREAARIQIDKELRRLSEDLDRVMNFVRAIPYERARNEAMLELRKELRTITNWEERFLRVGEKYELPFKYRVQ